MAIAWAGKSVFLTGHTGFKGSWLSLWLQQLGARVSGYALAPATVPDLFTVARVAEEMQRSTIGDVADLAALKDAVLAGQPEVIFHMAAQPLVRASYVDPVGTYATNVMGTVHLLEAARACPSVRAIVVITTDKCYRNNEWEWPYRELDRLGGHDPYSNSKAGAELAVAAYRDSFFSPARYGEHGVALASVRAGNVIGGGDWSEDRLIPDMIRAFGKGEPVRIRNPRAVRPWQHVLEPLRGYIAVAESLLEHGTRDAEAWNFGPDFADARPVEWIVRELAERWGKGAEWQLDGGDHPHEAQMLRLDCSKAAGRLAWRPALRLDEALALTVDWYRAQAAGNEMRNYTLRQIENYRASTEKERP